MGTRYIIGDTATGRRLNSLQVLTASWSCDLDVAETLSATIDLADPDNFKLGLRLAASPVRTFLAAIDTGAFGEDSGVIGAGPIWSTNYDRAAQTLQLNAKGIASIFDHRYILPPSARTAAVTTWVIPDPTDPSGVGTIPNPALATTYTGTIGDIAVQIVTQAMSWPYGTLPIVLPALVGGTSNTKTYDAADFKTVGSAITDLINLDVGVEIRFRARFTADGLGIEWVMETGSPTQPLLFNHDGDGSPIITRWNVTADQSPVAALTIDTDGSNMASLSWAVGGRSDDIALISRAEDDTLAASGFPFLETLDSTHNDVVIQSTLDSYAAANLTLAKSPAVTVTFTVKAYPVDEENLAAGPWLANYDVGDFVSLYFQAYDEEADRGDLYRPEGGDLTVRIVGLSGDEKGEDVSIRCAPVVS